MKIKNDIVTVVEFPRPKQPIGYIAFRKEGGEFFARHTKLKAMRSDCIEYNLEPAQVILYRVFKGEKDEERRMMFPNEFAFKVQKTIRMGSALIVEDVWSWNEPKGLHFNAQLGDHGFEYVFRPSRWGRIKLFLYSFFK